MTGQDSFIWHPNASAFVGQDLFVRAQMTAAPAAFSPILATTDRAAIQGLSDALAQEHGFCLHDGPLPPDLRAPSGSFLTLSAGSSGAPKIIQRSQASWISSFHVNADRFGYGSDDRVAVLGQLTHSLSLFGVLEGLHLGLDVHLLAALTVHGQHQALQSSAVTVLYATPTQIRLLTQRGARSPCLALRVLLCGGGPLDPATRAAARAMFPNAVCHVFYGAAETSFVTLGDRDTPEGSVGRPYPGVELQIRDENGRPTQATGEVWVRSPYLFAGYARGDSETTRWDGPYLSVGELGHLDANGCLWLRGRTSRLVTIADKTVSPEAIEATIAALPGITSCAVLPLPDPMRGHRLVAVIAGGSQGPSHAEVRDACRRVHGSQIAPNRIHTHPAFPYLSSGKPDLRAVARWLEGLS